MIDVIAESKFRLKGYLFAIFFPVSCPIAIGLLGVLASFIVDMNDLMDDLFGVLIMLFLCLNVFLVMILYYYFFRLFRLYLNVISIYNDGVDYHHIFAPLAKKQLTLHDIDYTVNTILKDKWGNESPATILVKDGRMCIVIYSYIYSNYEELVSALPWQSKGRYTLGFFNFLGFKINEDKIEPTQETE